MLLLQPRSSRHQFRHQESLDSPQWLSLSGIANRRFNVRHSLRQLHLHARTIGHVAAAFAAVPITSPVDAALAATTAVAPIGPALSAFPSERGASTATALAAAALAAAAVVGCVGGQQLPLHSLWQRVRWVRPVPLRVRLGYGSVRGDRDSDASKAALPAHCGRMALPGARMDMPFIWGRILRASWYHMHAVPCLAPLNTPVAAALATRAATCAAATRAAALRSRRRSAATTTFAATTFPSTLSTTLTATALSAASATTVPSAAVISTHRTTIYAVAPLGTRATLTSQPALATALATALCPLATSAAYSARGAAHATLCAQDVRCRRLDRAVWHRQRHGQLLRRVPTLPVRIWLLWQRRSPARRRQVNTWLWDVRPVQGGLRGEPRVPILRPLGNELRL